jgi:hypothetical protein
MRTLLLGNLCAEFWKLLLFFPKYTRMNENEREISVFVLKVIYNIHLGSFVYAVISNLFSKLMWSSCVESRKIYRSIFSKKQRLSQVLRVANSKMEHFLCTVKFMVKLSQSIFDIVGEQAKQNLKEMLI